MNWQQSLCLLCAIAITICFVVATAPAWKNATYAYRMRRNRRRRIRMMRELRVYDKTPPIFRDHKGIYR